jgi:cation diffusion facilitator family transporter
MSGCSGHRSERRTQLVAVLALVTMAVEIVVGAWTGSMALLADGWHMASHAGALVLASAAYWVARRFHAQDRFAFGPGKVATLAGFTNALILGLVAVLMGVESCERVIFPATVRFDEALLIAVLGLVVNVISVRLLHPAHADERHDHNLRSAYAHLVADVLTSVLAIAALLAGHFTGLARLDAVAGLVGALVILWWAVGLLRATVPELVDICVDRERVTALLGERLSASSDARLIDVRVWSLGAGRLACHLDVAGPPAELSNACRDLLERMPAIQHLSTTVQPPRSKTGTQPAHLDTARRRLAGPPEPAREQHLNAGRREEASLLQELRFDEGAPHHEGQRQHRHAEHEGTWACLTDEPGGRDGNHGDHRPLHPLGVGQRGDRGWQPGR